MKALSIRQPWAWLIVNGFKDFENRRWNTKYRGQVLIHASSQLTKMEYQTAAELIFSINPDIFLPSFEELQRGGIIGIATIAGTCESSPSPWFFGPVGFQLRDGQPLPFYPMRGRLSFFDTNLSMGKYGLLVPEVKP